MCVPPFFPGCQRLPTTREARPGPADAGARGLWLGRVRQEEHSGAQSAGAARWLCFIWPRREFIFRCGLHTHTSGRKPSQSQARDATGWARVVVTCHLAASVPRPCRSHKADVQGQEPVLPSFSVSVCTLSALSSGMGGVSRAGLRSSGSSADRCLPSFRGKTEDSENQAVRRKRWEMRMAMLLGSTDDGWIIEPRSRFQRWSTPLLHSACGSGPAMTQCSGDVQEPRHHLLSPSGGEGWPGASNRARWSQRWLGPGWLGTDGADRSTLGRSSGVPIRDCGQAGRPEPSKLGAHRRRKHSLSAMQLTPRLSQSTHRFLAGQLARWWWNVARGPICSGCCPTGRRRGGDSHSGTRQEQLHPAARYPQAAAARWNGGAGQRRRVGCWDGMEAVEIGAWMQVLVGLL